MYVEEEQGEHELHDLRFKVVRLSASNRPERCVLSASMPEDPHSRTTDAKTTTTIANGTLALQRFLHVSHFILIHHSALSFRVNVSPDDGEEQGGRAGIDNVMSHVSRTRYAKVEYMYRAT